ncbi:MAG TPA: c-type cytochrome [Acidimicrobiales bacterium]|nr:c-type cytochrome [Acidimicrobiales bacterium]
MSHLNAAPLLVGAVQQQLGLAIVALSVVGLLIYVALQIKGSGEPPGAEIELAPNRRPYYEDEDMEGRRLDQSLTWALLLLIITGIGLPLYWLNEPSRQSGAIAAFDEEAAGRGFHLFSTGPTEGGHNIGNYGCEKCHGPNGQGGAASYVILPGEDEPDALPRKVVWSAPPLDNVLRRFSDEEVVEIITYGRKNTPMPAWGVDGGGPMNEQQVTDLLAYIKTLQITDEEQAKRVREQMGQYGPDGEGLFEANCARCHTKGFSYSEPELAGGGAYGPSLIQGVTTRQFPNREDHVDFVTEGSDFKVAYGERGEGTGRMPGFGTMLSKEQIEAIVDYERSL